MGHEINRFTSDQKANLIQQLGGTFGISEFPVRNPGSVHRAGVSLTRTSQHLIKVFNKKKLESNDYIWVNVGVSVFK